MKGKEYLNKYASHQPMMHKFLQQITSRQKEVPAKIFQ